MGHRIRRVLLSLLMVALIASPASAARAPAHQRSPVEIQTEQTCWPTMGGEFPLPGHIQAPTPDGPVVAWCILVETGRFP